MRRGRTPDPGRCDEVEALLPLHVADELSRWSRRRVARHLRRCASCAAAEARQREVAEELERLGRDTTPPADVAAPPDDLLDTLLAQARDPGLRGRAAVPARGAVSGARPGLSVALVVAVLVAVGTAGWLGWQAGRAVRDRRRGE